MKSRVAMKRKSVVKRQIVLAYIPMFACAGVAFGGQWPPEEKREIFTNSIGMKFVHVKLGTFQRGS
jgi:hypothetical protein